VGMRPAARMPKLTRRSRILIAIALAVVVLLLVGPRFIDTYVDWLWFGELGYRSVFSTVLITRLAVFLVVGLVVAAIVFAGLALAYRTRPVFVPANGPNDPVARYRTAVLSRLKLIGFGLPAVIGVLAGLFAQGAWVLLSHSLGSFSGLSLGAQFFMPARSSRARTLSISLPRLSIAAWGVFSPVTAEATFGQNSWASFG